MKLLIAKDISHSFDYELFSNINFDLEIRESKAILGRSGSGKSTLLHILSTFIKPDKGDINLLGQDIYSLPAKEIEKIRRFNLGIIFQAHYLFKGMSAIENLEIATILSNTKIDNKLIKKLEIDNSLLHKKLETYLEDNSKESLLLGF